ncbi:MAG: hypothetical protein E6G83_16155 [Alphaproteobacteria bacterium]|nr:MAG: hypothetical protein E6G83_16155 [Alphaproteobacteria bacterium]
MAEKDPAESGRRLHVTTLLVASRRALDNALSELGFAEDDDRIVEHDGRLARPVEAVDAAVEDEPEPDTADSPLHDVETAEGLASLKRILKRIEPADAFATIRAGRDGRATARVLRRGSRRLLAAATAADESTLRSVIREILPNVMLDVAMKPPG